VSFTLIRTVIGSVRERIGFGEKVTWSMTSRSFDGTLATGIDFSPFGSVITPDGPCGPCTAGLGAVSLLASPWLLRAITRARIVFPTSPSRRT
jgi:hypothetical protein